jgi:hypothetical protein
MLQPGHIRERTPRTPTLTLALRLRFQGVFYAGGAQYANADLPGTIKGS